MTICPHCHAPLPEGVTECQTVWDEISVLAYAHPTYAVTRDLAFDTYCMQHPEHYGRSAKSYAAHLMRLCCGLEYRADPTVYTAIRRWLDGKVELEKPTLLSERGQRTVLSLRATTDPIEHNRLAREWAEDVWAAYHSQHALARQWLQTALEHH